MKNTKVNIERIHKVVSYIEQGIDKEMTLDELASIACFSPFHFQRIFKELIGETPKQFIKRLRLEESARIIAFHADQNILDVALKVGFQSLESFSRAFKDYYSISPDYYRKSSELDRINISQLPYRKNLVIDETQLNISFSNFENEFDSLDIKIVKRPTQKCVYVQTTLQSPQLIQESFKRIKLWSKAHELLNDDSTIFGLIKDYPIFTPIEKCRFMSCISVNNPTITTGLINSVEIPSGKYASFMVTGGIKEIVNAASFLVHSWLPENQYKLKLEPIIQIPVQDPAETHFNENQYQILIPVQPE